MITHNITKQQSEKLDDIIKQIESDDSEIHLPKYMFDLDKSELLKIISKLL